MERNGRALRVCSCMVLWEKSSLGYETRKNLRKMRLRGKGNHAVLKWVKIDYIFEGV